MILTVIPIDKYNLFRDCDFVNSLENKKIHKQKKSVPRSRFCLLYMFIIKDLL